MGESPESYIQGAQNMPVVFQMSQLYTANLSKRGLAYQCLRCHMPEVYIAERSRVEAHLWKRHLPLDQAPYFCTLCLYRSTDYRSLANHIKSFQPHINHRNSLAKEGKFLGEEMYLKASTNTHMFNYNPAEPDYRQLRPVESRQYWTSKARGQPAQATVMPASTVIQPRQPPYYSSSVPAMAMPTPAVMKFQGTSSSSVSIGHLNFGQPEAHQPLASATCSSTPAATSQRVMPNIARYLPLDHLNE